MQEGRGADSLCPQPAPDHPCRLRARLPVEKVPSSPARAELAQVLEPAHLTPHCTDGKAKAQGGTRLFRCPTAVRAEWKPPPPSQQPRPPPSRGRMARWVGARLLYAHRPLNPAQSRRPGSLRRLEDTGNTPGARSHPQDPAPPLCFHGGPAGGRELDPYQVVGQRHGPGSGAHSQERHGH